MAVDSKQWLLWVSEIQAHCRSGLAFTQNEFDRQRLLRIAEIAAEITADVTCSPPDVIKSLFTIEQKAYATPVIDIRSFVLKEDKVLLVKERMDGLWTLPGGFADVNESPSEAVVRETLEESGFLVKPKTLLALWDKLKHDHPLQWPHIYKCIFHCELIAGEPKINIEISGIDFFSMTDLPPLSTPRITLKQMNVLYDLVANPQQTLFD